MKGLSFHVDEGEVVSLIGSNGAGKTTTLHAISGIVKKAGGTITFDGKDITNEKAHRIVGLGISQVQEGRGESQSTTTSLRDNSGSGSETTTTPKENSGNKGQWDVD